MTNTNKNNNAPADEPIPGLGWMAGGLVAAAAVTWTIPTVAGLVHSGHAPHIGPVGALISALRVLSGGDLSDPATAYPPDVRAGLPGPLLWWLSTTAVLGGIAVLVAMAMRYVEPEIARERLGRRPFEWRGARPREWARHRDLRQPRRAPRGFSLGRLDGRPIFADEEAHVVVVAPTRAGKTTRCVIPWLLEHDGPAIVTSTDRDVIDATREARGRRGTIWIFDPFSSDSMSWSPLDGCESWSGALQQAQWLAQSSSDGDAEIARYWRGEAAKLLAPLLHAAALDDKDMTSVLNWVDVQETRAVASILEKARSAPARAQLRAITELDPRNRGTTYMSAGSVLEAYRYPEVQRLDGDHFNADHFLRSNADTLFLVAGDRYQQLVAPLFVSLLSAVIHRAIEVGAFRSGERRLKLLLDEAANVAPLVDLPRLMSQIGKHGIRAATIWQSIAQLQERYGRGAETILANSAAKLYLGPITDNMTCEQVAVQLGREGGARRRNEGPAAQLQQLRGDRALLLYGGHMPALTQLRPYWVGTDGRRGASLGEG
jgi:type IV secretory pathway TraG/TraD family ATPase VirD4